MPHALPHPLRVQRKQRTLGFLKGLRRRGLGVLEGGNGLLTGLNAFPAGVIPLHPLGILFPQRGGGHGTAQRADDGARGLLGHMLFQRLMQKREVDGQRFIDQVMQHAAGDGALGAGEPFLADGHDNLHAGLGI